MPCKPRIPVHANLARAMCAESESSALQHFGEAPRRLPCQPPFRRTWDLSLWCMHIQSPSAFWPAQAQWVRALDKLRVEVSPQEPLDWACLQMTRVIALLLVWLQLCLLRSSGDG